MSERRVDLLVPGPEGGWLARALEQAGMVTFRRDAGQPPSQGVGVVVVALSLEAGSNARESFETQLAQAREGLPPETPLVALLPVDAQLDDGLRSLAQGVYARPVPVARLVHKIEDLLNVAQGGGPRPSWSPGTSPSVDVSVVTLKPSVLPPHSEDGVRERTMRLDDPELSTHGRSTSPPASASSPPPGSYPGGEDHASNPGTGDGESVTPVAPLSPWLHAILRDCDRQMFPAAPPLDLRFPASEDGPLELVPKVLLDVLGVPVDAPANDLFEGHTFAGESPWVEQSLPRKRHSEWPRLESSAPGSSGSSGRAGSGPPRARTGSQAGSQPGSNSGSQPGSDVRPPSGAQSMVRASDPPPSSPPAVSSLPNVGDALPREAFAESVVARSPEGHAGGPPPSDAVSAESRGSVPSAAGLYETAVEVHRYTSRPSPPALSVGTPTADGRGRWGTLVPDEWPGFALAVSGVAGDKRLSLRTARDGVLLLVRAGEVLAPLEASAEVPDPSAQLEDGSDVDPLAELHRLRRGRHAARERVLAALTPPWAVSSGSRGARRAAEDPELVFEVYDVPVGSPATDGWPLGSLLTLMLEALAGWVTADWLKHYWVDRLGHALVVDASAAEWAARLGLDGLWVDWLRGCQGRPLESLLTALPDGEGLPRALLVLAGVGAISFDDTPRDAERVPLILELRVRARRLIESAYASTRNADYFTLLGVRPSASAHAVERACAACMAPLLGLDLETLGLSELSPLRTDVLECYAEAQRALRDDDARARYARALGLLGGA